MRERAHNTAQRQHNATTATNPQNITLKHQCKQLKLIDGQRTEVVVMSFHDRILVVVTQLGKIGTVVFAFVDMCTRVW